MAGSIILTFTSETWRTFHQQKLHKSLQYNKSLTVYCTWFYHNPNPHFGRHNYLHTPLNSNTFLTHLACHLWKTAFSMFSETYLTHHHVVKPCPTGWSLVQISPNDLHPRFSSPSCGPGFFMNMWPPFGGGYLAISQQTLTKGNVTILCQGYPYEPTRLNSYKDFN